VSEPTRRRDVALLVAASILLFGVSLGAHDLWNPNEPIYGEAVKEMRARGSLAVPYVNDQQFGEKPILYYWLALASSGLLGGISELSLRVPSALAGVGVVVGSYLLVLPYAGRRRALVTAVACMTTYQVWWLSRTVQMDVLVVAATLWTILPGGRVLDFGAPPWKGWAWGGVALGLGFLAKGPVAWICPGLVLLAYAVATRRVRALLSAPEAAGAAVAIAVAAPWYVHLAVSGHADLVHEVLVRQNFMRFTDPWDHVAPPWYYLPYVFVGMAPWAFFAVVSRRDGRLSRLALSWIVSIVVFFSLSKSKRDPYIAPIAPAVAILAAEVMVAFSADRLSRVRRTVVLAIAVALAALLLAGALAAGALVAPRYPKEAAAAWTLAIACSGAGAAIAVAALSPRARSWLVPAIAGGTACVYLVAGSVVLPALDRYKSARSICRSIAEIAGPGDRVASYNFWKWRAEYRFYLERPIENLLGSDALRTAWAGSDRIVLIVDRPGLASAREIVGDREPAVSRPVGSQTIHVFTSR
jgi:4-amino-4-deoxy-L-arabinose transferase-like glycosyltransferase